MKIAVCVSGIPRSGVALEQNKNQDFNRNLDSLKNNFPTADIYLATWKEHKKSFDSYPVFAEYPHWFFDQPQAHYHPYLDLPKKNMVSEKMQTISDIYKNRPRSHERTRYLCYQILCHASMVNNLPEKYDIIVRARFDTFTYTHANFEQYINDVYNNKTAIGFANLDEDRPSFNINREINKSDPNQNDGGVTLANVRQKHLFDSLIIHHGDCIDTKWIFELYEQKQLCPSEFGWYQVLSQPYNDNHRCVSGWANADKHVNRNFLMDNEARK